MVDTNLSSKVEIEIALSNLPRLDTFSKSDGFVVVKIKDHKSGSWTPLGHTEVIKNNQNPKFTKKFTIEYKFEESQDLLFEAYDADSAVTELIVSDLSKHDFIGSYETVLGELVASPGQHIQTHLRKKNGTLSPASLKVRVEELKEVAEYCKIEMVGKSLEKMDLFGKSDPFFQIFRSHTDGELVKVYESEVIKNTLDPKWKPFQLTVSQLCNGDYKRPIVIKVFDWEKSDAPEYMGEFSATLHQLIGTDEKKDESWIPGPFYLTRPHHKDPKKRTTNHGTIVFLKFQLLRDPTFIDYLRGGMRIGLMVAIDYTGSNGDPSDKDSLHYRGGTTDNPYQKAIRTIGSILAPYDEDNMYSVWGFGGKVGSETLHCFPVNGNPSQPEVKGVDGILDIYNKSFDHVVLSGPTLFSEVLTTASSIAGTPYTSTLQHYTILLIITDGVINDMPKTVETLVNASKLPLSVVIVGVGGADFKQMEKLDGDDTALSSGGKKTARDIVQFVPLRKFEKQPLSALAKETLAEIPKQVLAFMKLKGLAPLPPRPPVVFVPQIVMSPPPQGYAPPPQGYAPPPEGYAPPPQGYAPPPQGYAPPPQGYAPPPQGYAPPPQGYAPPPSSTTTTTTTTTK